jgi:hypothetical protein
VPPNKQEGRGYRPALTFWFLLPSPPLVDGPPIPDLRPSRLSRYHVPISQEERYFFWSGSSSSISMPMALSLRAATWRSISSGTS